MLFQRQETSMDTEFVYATNSIMPRQHPIKISLKKKKKQNKTKTKTKTKTKAKAKAKNKKTMDACVDAGNGNVFRDIKNW